MLSSIFDQASKSVTRTILYAGLIPVMAVLLFNGGVALALLGPGAAANVSGWLNQSATAVGASVTAGAILLIISAVAIAALAPVFRGILEGRTWLPLFSSVLDAAREQAVARMEQRRVEGQRARETLARRVQLRTAEESALKDARRNASRDANPRKLAVESLWADVERELGGDDREAGAANASGRLKRHFSEHGTAQTHRSHQAILDRLDDLVRAAAGELSGVSRMRADVPTTDGPVTRYGYELQFIEKYVEAVYSIASVVFWTRLQHVIPATFAARLEDAKHSLDLLTAMTVLIWASTFGWFVAIPVVFPGWSVLIAVTAGGWAVGYVAYRSAAAAALAFGELVCGAFDLFRRDLLVALNVKPPDTLREERALWLQLGQLMIYEQMPDELTLTPPAPAVVRTVAPADGADRSIGASPIVVPDARGRR